MLTSAECAQSAVLDGGAVRCERDPWHASNNNNEWLRTASISLITVED